MIRERCCFKRVLNNLRTWSGDYAQLGYATGRKINFCFVLLTFVLIYCFSGCAVSEKTMIKSFRICNYTESEQKLPTSLTKPCLSGLKSNEMWKSDTLEITYILEKSDYIRNFRSSRPVDLSQLGQFDVEYITFKQDECKTFKLSRKENDCFYKYQYPRIIKFYINSEIILLENRRGEYHFGNFLH
jgi:hypothetical protein